MNRHRKEPTSVNLDDLDWLRVLIGSGGRRLERQVTASLKLTSVVKFTHAEKIDALLALAARGVLAAERIARCMERKTKTRRRTTRKATR